MSHMGHAATLPRDHRTTALILTGATLAALAAHATTRIVTGPDMPPPLLTAGRALVVTLAALSLAWWGWTGHAAILAALAPPRAVGRAPVPRPPDDVDTVVIIHTSWPSTGSAGWPVGDREELRSLLVITAEAPTQEARVAGCYQIGYAEGLVRAAYARLRGRADDALRDIRRRHRDDPPT